MASILTTVYENAWTPVRNQLIALPSHNIPYIDAWFPIHLYTLLVALNNVSKNIFHFRSHPIFWIDYIFLDIERNKQYPLLYQ